MKLIKNKKYNPDTCEIDKQSPFTSKLKLGEKFLTEVAASTTILVHFKLNTGDEEFHIVKVTKKRFLLYKKTYLVDTKYLTYNRTFKLFMATYHEDLALPIKQIIDVNSIKNGINNHKDYALVKSNVNPAILTEYSKSKVIQDTLQGHALTSVMGFLKVMAILTLIAIIIVLILNLQMSGLFSK